MIPNATTLTPLSIFVYNGTVYTAGNDSNGNACYWAGRKQVELITGPYIGPQAVRGAAKSIFVYNNTVYVAGEDEFSNACFWEGTNKNILASHDSSTGLYPQANKILVYNNIVYTAGLDSGEEACYWTGTTETQMTTGTYYGGHEAYIRNLFVYKGAVYIQGQNNDLTPFFWTGSSQTTLPAHFGNSIYVYNDIIYSVGKYINSQMQEFDCIWKGPDETDIPLVEKSDGNMYLLSVYVNDGTVYSVGTDHISQQVGKDGEGKPIYAYITQACCWVDTSEVQLTNGINGGTTYAVCGNVQIP